MLAKVKNADGTIGIFVIKVGHGQCSTVTTLNTWIKVAKCSKCFIYSVVKIQTELFIGVYISYKDKWQVTNLLTIFKSLHLR